MSKLKLFSLVCVLIVVNLKKKSNLVKSESEDLDVHHKTKLWKHLKENYEPEIHPTTTSLKFGLSLIYVKLDLEENTMISHIWPRMVWTDPRLKWVEADWNGVSVLKVRPNSIWIPDMALYNSLGNSLMFGKDTLCSNTNVIIYPHGEVLWVPSCTLKSPCDLAPLRLHSQGKVKCRMKFGSWTHDGFVIDLNLYDDIEIIDMSNFVNNYGYEVISNSGKRNEIYFACCDEPYMDLTFYLTIKEQDPYTNSTMK